MTELEDGEGEVSDEIDEVRFFSLIVFVDRPLCTRLPTEDTSTSAAFSSRRASQLMSLMEMDGR